MLLPLCKATNVDKKDENGQRRTLSTRTYQEHIRLAESMSGSKVASTSLQDVLVEEVPTQSDKPGFFLKISAGMIVVLEEDSFFKHKDQSMDWMLRSHRLCQRLRDEGGKASGAKRTADAYHLAFSENLKRKHDKTFG